MAKSFLKSVEPNRPREISVDWPFPVDGETPKVKMRVLGSHEAEAAYLETCDYFKGLKDAKGKARAVDMSDPAFQHREKASLVWRAFSSDGNPIAEDVAELAAQPIEVVSALCAQWQAFQSDVTAHPVTKPQMDFLIAELKKNTQAVPLTALPLSWLIALITTLASPPQDSTPDSSDGS